MKELIKGFLGLEPLAFNLGLIGAIIFFVWAYFFWLRR